MSNYLSKADILGAKDARFEEVDVPEWGGRVRIKAMSGSERDAFEQSITSLRKNGSKMAQAMNLENVRAKLLARCIVDEEGGLIFDAEDVEALGQKNAAALDRCVEVAKRLNGMNKGDLEQLANELKNAPPAG